MFVFVGMCYRLFIENMELKNVKMRAFDSLVRGETLLFKQTLFIHLFITIQ